MVGENETRDKSSAMGARTYGFYIALRDDMGQR